MSNTTETKEGVKTYTLKVMNDEICESPRTFCENLGVMVCFHGRYSLGDKHDINSDDYDGWDDMEKYITGKLDTSVILPLYLYDHSGITISTSPFSCRWDSGQIGFIYVTKENVRKEYNVKRITKSIREKVIEVLEGEVKDYDQYLTGDVYRYEIEDEDGDVVDSCGGYYDKDECQSDGENLLEYYQKESIEE